MVFKTYEEAAQRLQPGESIVALKWNSELVRYVTTSEPHKLDTPQLVIVAYAAKEQQP